MYGRSTFYLTLLVLPISVILVALAEPILAWLYGAAFVAAAGALRILAVGLLFEFLVVPNMRVLVVVHRQDIAARIQGLSTLVGLALAIVLIPPLRMLGAALARVIAAAVLFLASYQHVHRRIIRYNILRSTWRLVVVAAFVAAMLFFVSPEISLIASLLLAGVTYLAGLGLVRALPKEDWQRLRKLLHVPGA
jgi:O-antigen/teichoic acid export membrane protein